MRRAGKASRDYALHTPIVPAAPAAPEARAAQLSWTTEDDVFLAALAKQYHDHWPLICDLFNAARQTLPTERRTPWDCYDRAKWLQAEADASTSADAAALRGKRPAPKAEGARKKQHRTHLLEAMRRSAKRREQAQRQAAASASANGARRVNLATHDTHAQVKSSATPTPQALSLLKAERDQAAIRQFFEQQRAAQHAEEAERQRDQAGDQPLLSLLLALCRDGRIAHASASSAAAICLKSSSRSSGSALSCRPGMPWFSHQSPAST